MSNKGKYIIVDIGQGIEFAILFDETLDHKTVAGDFKVISAGFFSTYIDNNIEFNVSHYVIDVSAYGKSTSLNIGSRGKEDEFAIKRVIRV